MLTLAAPLEFFAKHEPRDRVKHQLERPVLEAVHGHDQYGLKTA